MNDSCREKLHKIGIHMKNEQIGQGPLLLPDEEDFPHS